MKLENRQIQHIEWHNKRFNEARRQLFGMGDELDLRQIVSIPVSLQNVVYKCRLLYREKVEEIQFQIYNPRNVRVLQLLNDDEIDYAYKYEDRSAFDRLLAKKGDADDILIVKNGCITDTSYSNIAFFDGKRWWTPDTFLLNGTQRQRLIAEGVITVAPITPSDLGCFSQAKPINALLDFKMTPVVEIRY